MQATNNAEILKRKKKNTQTHTYTGKDNSKKAVNKQKQFHLNPMDHFQRNICVYECV